MNMNILLPLALFVFIYNLSFSQNIPYPTTPDWESTPAGHIATGLGLADIDNDGWKDLVVSNGNDIQRQNLVVYYNNGDGTFPLTPDWQSDDIDYHGHLAVGDINLDGWLDVAVSVYIGPNGFSEPGKVKVYYNIGGELEGTPSFESYEFYTFSCALADADGDGDLDLATTGGEPYSSLYDQGKIFENRNGTFSENPEWTSSLDFGSLDVDFGDVDENGFMDIIFASEETPSYIFLADENGNISTDPSWESGESTNYINSVDFGFIGNNKYPGVVMTGNNQLGGDGKVRLYDFEDGVPTSSIASWTSPPFGYGSGILLSDVDLDGILDLIYGGWWLPVKIVLGNETAFETSAAYTSTSTSVVETIQIADLDRDGIVTTSETFIITESEISSIYLEKQLIENILGVQFNGKIIDRSFYCSVPNKNWISFKDNLKPGDEVTIEYEFSNDGDMVISNWDSGKGNFIFYNSPQSTGDTEQSIDLDIATIKLFPNPVDDILTITYLSETKQLVEVKLTDLTGKTCLLTHREWLKTGSNHIEINTEKLLPGIYQLELKSGKYKEVRKVVKK